MTFFCIFALNLLTMRFCTALRFAYQPDVLEWVEANKPALAAMRKDKEAAKESLFSLKKYLSPKKEIPAEATETPAETAKEEAVKIGDTLMQQYYQSQELRNILKWKRITWDKGADYDGLAARLTDCADILRKQKAFSFLGVHFVRDAATVRLQKACGLPDEAFVPLPMHEISTGSLTSWYTTENEPKAAAAVDPEAAPYTRAEPFTVCWETGKVHMLDSISPGEVLYFIKNFAHRAQQTQLRIEEEQTKLNEAVENVRFRCTLDGLKFNAEDQAFRHGVLTDSFTDKTAVKANTLSPTEVLRFCDGMLKTAWLYRSVLRGQQVRIGGPGTSYAIDEAKGEVRIPCDFDEYSWKPEHEKYMRHEAIANSYRNHWYVWLLFATFLIGDFDVL